MNNLVDLKKMFQNLTAENIETIQESGILLIERIEELEEKVKKLTEENEMFREALDFYANEHNYYFEIEIDYDYEETKMIKEGAIFRDLGEWARDVLWKSRNDEN